MLVLLVTMQLKSEHRQEFIAAITEDAKGSVQDEPGCVRFDVVQDEGDPNRFYLHEVYRDQAAFDAHREAPHFQRFRDLGAARDWFASPATRSLGVEVYLST